MMLLATSLAALAVGPLIYAWAQSRPALMRSLDGFVFVAIGGLVVVDVLPDIVAHAGWWVLAFVALGLWGPELMERLFARHAHRTHVWTLVLSACGLVIHAAFDGAALNERGHLALAVVLHRIPVGVAVWWLLRPSLGLLLPSLLLLLLAAMTVLGFVLGENLAAPGLVNEYAALQAFVAGSILHVVFNRPHLDPKLEEGPAPSGRAEGLGNIVGLLLFIGVIGSEMVAGEDLLPGYVRLLDLSLAAAPALLLAYFAGGLMAGFMPESSIRWLSRGNHFSQAARGVIVGLPLPVCSCGVVPLYRSFIERGAPPSAAIAFLIATPELGLDAVLISFPLLGADMTMARILAAGAVALAVGWALGRYASLRGADAGCCHNHLPEIRGSVGQRMQAGLRYGFGDLVDATAPWLVLGVIIAAIAQPLLELPQLQAIPDSVQVLVFALIGLPIYVCAAGSTPIVAVMLIAGVSPGAALAFLLTGPATNPATFGVLARLHGRTLALAFGVATGGLAVLSGLLLNASGMAIDVREVLHEVFPGPVAWTSLIILCLVIGISLLRQGARQFLAELRLGRAAA